MGNIKAPPYYDLSMTDMLMKCVYELTPPIRPIAYMENSYDDEYVFEADGKYFFWAPDAQELWLLHDAQSDKAALNALATEKQTQILSVKGGYEKLADLEREQMAKAKADR
jgi:hypothetical protein